MVPRKTVAIGKFCLDLEISEAFSMGLKDSFFKSGDLRLGVSNFLCLGTSRILKSWSRTRTLLDLPPDDCVSAERARDGREASESERRKPPNQQKPETGFEKVSSTLPTRRRRL